jgi:Tol biopolymer transport system component
MSTLRSPAAHVASLACLLALASCSSAPAPVQSVPARVEGPRTVVVHDLCWSANGRVLFFSARSFAADRPDDPEQGWSVFRYEIGSRAPVRIAPAALGVSCDPSGTRLAVARLAGKTRDLYLLDRDGKDLARLTQDPGDELDATWSADGKQLAFEHRAGAEREIYLVSPGGLGPRRISSGGNAGAPSWSPDNLHIAYCLDAGDGKAQIWLMNADGTDPRNLTRDTLNNVSPSWMPDGRVVYSSGMRGAPTRILTIDVDGSEKRPVPGLEAECARFSRDGTRVAYFGREPVLVIAGADGTRIDRVPFEAIASADVAR